MRTPAYSPLANGVTLNCDVTGSRDTADQSGLNSDSLLGLLLQIWLRSIKVIKLSYIN